MFFREINRRKNRFKMTVSSRDQTLRQHIESELLILPRARAIIFDECNRIFLVKLNEAANSGVRFLCDANGSN
jgi:hypothetical protein